jgi:hypothetical protein
MQKLRTRTSEEQAPPPEVKKKVKRKPAKAKTAPRQVLRCPCGLAIPAAALDARDNKKPYSARTAKAALPATDRIKYCWWWGPGDTVVSS